MCDSIVVDRKLSGKGCTVFGKASDRRVNEPQPFVYVPAADHEPGSKVKCTYIEVEQAPHTYAAILAKPSWIWGAEIGVNEFGLCIGNEAVITRETETEGESLLGMDILRMALERAKTAEEAVDVIADLMERYGQGGNAGFDSPLHFYDNAYLITDGQETWFVETAGKHLWAAKRVKGGYSISNCPALDRPEKMHPDLLRVAQEKGYPMEEPFHFAAAFGDWESRLTASGLMRRSCTFPAANVSDCFTDRDMAALLRSHSVADYWTRGGHCVCMHAASAEMQSQTACAMIALCRGKDTAMWGTGMSTTCIAPFQPFWLDAFSEKQVFAYENMEAGVEEWLRREKIHRAMLAGKIPEEVYKQELQVMEEDWFARVEAVDPDRASRQALCDAISEEADAFFTRWLDYADKAKASPMGESEFRAWWAPRNDALGKDRRLAR